MISVIVPVYNVENYLERCLKSIINQTYKELEIILVDDGSTDLSGKICDEFKKKDKRINVIHKENGGLSSARNRGLDIAKGEFIGFVDSDDFIHPQMYEILYRAAVEKKLDLVSCKTYDTNDGNVDLVSYDVANEIKNMEVADKEKILNNFSEEYYTKIWMTAMHKLYNRKIFEGIRFKEGKIYEDEFSFHHIIDKCDNVGIMETVLYYYYLSPDSIIRSRFSSRRFDLIDATYDRFEFFLHKKIGKEIDYWGIKYIAKIIEMWHQICQENPEYKKSFRKKYIVKLKDERIKKCSITFRQKMHVWLIVNFPEIESKIYKKH